MSITLIAVVIALVIGHTMPALVALRRYDWFIRWLEWLAAQLGDNASWRGAGGMLFAIGPPLLLVALLQIALRGEGMEAAVLVAFTHGAFTHGNWTLEAVYD